MGERIDNDGIKTVSILLRMDEIYKERNSKKGGNNKLITIMRKGNQAVQITTAKSADLHRAIEYITLVIVADKHGRFMLQANERYSESKDTDAIRNHKNIIKRYKLQGFKVTED